MGKGKRGQKRTENAPSSSYIITLTAPGPEQSEMHSDLMRTPPSSGHFRVERAALKRLLPDLLVLPYDNMVDQYHPSRSRQERI